MMFAPLEGWRHVKVTDRHTALDYAQVLKELSDTHFPNAKKIVLIQWIISTRTSPRRSTTAFPLRPRHRRLVGRFEWRARPEHASSLVSWLNSEFGVLSFQCPRPANPGSANSVKERSIVFCGERRRYRRQNARRSRTRRFHHLVRRSRPSPVEEALYPPGLFNAL